MGVIQLEFENRIKSALGHSLFESIKNQLQIELMQKEINELKEQLAGATGEPATE